ncbi:hypothetical protein [Malikia sp.]|uniref:hypothetical protein n=1 Tax=Malikia sp. TaxID=2070706 RepID=UPI00262D0BB5|nr:hypothetical protein [Malikia sp.]MDD2730384.1 hypothetical protein [Malikia sp.]
MSRQLELDLPTPSAKPRETSPLERLRQIIRRKGIDPAWRGAAFHRGWIMPLPCLDPGDRLRIGPRPERPGLPASGAWETLCAWHVNAAKHCPEETRAYRERIGGAA